VTYTYTYTVRNSENPERAATFTIVDDHLRVNLTGLDDQIPQMLSGSQQIRPIKQFLTTQSGTIALQNKSKACPDLFTFEMSHQI